MTPPNKERLTNQDDLYDTDADQPEVLYDEDSQYQNEHKPSQAEGDRETVEEDLKDKSAADSS